MSKPGMALRTSVASFVLLFTFPSFAIVANPEYVENEEFVGEDIIVSRPRVSITSQSGGYSASYSTYGYTVTRSMTSPNTIATDLQAFLDSQGVAPTELVDMLEEGDASAEVIEEIVVTADRRNESERVQKFLSTSFKDFKSYYLALIDLQLELRNIGRECKCLIGVNENLELALEQRNRERSMFVHGQPSDTLSDIANGRARLTEIPTMTNEPVYTDDILGTTYFFPNF